MNLLPPDELQCFTLPHFKQFLRKRNILCLCEWVDVDSVLDLQTFNELWSKALGEHELIHGLKGRDYIIIYIIW